ncbi:MAG TPA: DUF6794 domain-containing protein [Ignavibacteria bacterium]
MDKLNYPKTISEAVDVLMHIMPEEDLAKIKSMSEDDLDFSHISLGVWIRNNFGLWDENYELMKDCEASNEDDASNIIIRHLIKELKK